MSVACPICWKAGQLELANCEDVVHHVPGKRTYWRCIGCDSLFMWPIPAASEVPGLYPPSYRFIREAPENQIPRSDNFRQRVKRTMLAQRYGYDELRDPSGLVRSLAALFGANAELRVRAGFPVRFVPHRLGGRLLDIGSGNGSFLTTMQSLGWSVEGIEPDQEAANNSKAAGLRVENATVENANLPAGFFDAITMSHVIEHVIDLNRTVAVVAKALAPGGVFVSISPNPIGYLARRFGRAWRELDAPRHFVLPSPDGYVALLTRAGFEARCFTSTRLTSPVARESAALAGQLGTHQKVALAANLHFATNPRCGEEVVCIARKPLK